MLTTPITTPHFHARVLTILSNFFSEVDANPSKDLPIPTIPALSAVDTPLAPDKIVSQVLAVASPWIDLSSPDPVIYDISRQVLELEIAYAAFCGVGNIILPRPRLHHGKLHREGITQYAYAIQEALAIGIYIQLSVSLPMMDNPEEEEDDDHKSLAARARGKYMGLSPDECEHFSMVGLEQTDEKSSGTRSSRRAVKFDFFGTWDAWNVIRTLCKYSNRLYVGKNRAIHSLQPSSHLCEPSSHRTPEGGFFTVELSMVVVEDNL